jgi:hypothetical protein
MPKPIIPSSITPSPAGLRPLPHGLRLEVEDDAQELHELWSMSRAERVAAMWRGQLSLYQLSKWSSHRPQEVPLLGGELAWIAMRTPEWLGDHDEECS